MDWESYEILQPYLFAITLKTFFLLQLPLKILHVFNVWID